MVQDHNDVDLVIQRNPIESELDAVVCRLVRDLQVSSALCTAESAGRLQVLAWAGIDPLPFLRSIRSVGPVFQGGFAQMSSPCCELKSAGIGSYIAVPIGSDDRTLTGVLWAADARRRWFDHGEIHHLQLLARRASAPLQARFAIGLSDIGLDEPAVRTSDRILSLR